MNTEQWVVVGTLVLAVFAFKWIMSYLEPRMKEEPMPRPEKISVGVRAPAQQVYWRLHYIDAAVIHAIRIEVRGETHERVHEGERFEEDIYFEVSDQMESEFASPLKFMTFEKANFYGANLADVHGLRFIPYEPAVRRTAVTRYLDATNV